MNILLAYSSKHFDPALAEQPEAVRYSSASVLASAWYNNLSKLGEVEYINALRLPKKLKRKHYDLLVTIQGCLCSLRRRASFDRCILFAVNMHPLARNARLRHFHSLVQSCPPRDLLKECVDLHAVDEVEAADAIFLVGNNTVARSFMEYGVPLEKVRPFNYASRLLPQEPRSCRQKPRFLYVATEMCLRKGFDLLEEMIRRLRERLGGDAFQLSIVGGQGKAYYRRRLERFCCELGDCVCYKGWINAASEEYRLLLREHDFLLFPSLEEGQAGSVLDALACAVIPILSYESGLDFSPLGFLECLPHSRHNDEILDKAVALGPEERLALRQAALAFYLREHVGWESVLEMALRQYLDSGKLWPTVQILREGEAMDGSAAAVVLYLPRGVEADSSYLPEALSAMGKSPHCGLLAWPRDLPPMVRGSILPLAVGAASAGHAVGPVLLCGALAQQLDPCASPVEILPRLSSAAEASGLNCACLFSSCDGPHASMELLSAPLPPHPRASAFLRLVAAPLLAAACCLLPVKAWRKQVYNYYREIRL